MNWNIVLEKHLLSIDHNQKINYITPSYDWNDYNRGNPEDGSKSVRYTAQVIGFIARTAKRSFIFLAKSYPFTKK